MVLRSFWHQNWLLAPVFSRLHIFSEPTCFSEPTWQFQNSNAKNSVFDYSKPLFDLTSQNITFMCYLFFKARPAKKKMWYQTSAINFLVLSGYWESKWLLPTVETALLPFNRMYFIPQCWEYFYSTNQMSSHDINIIFIILIKYISFHRIRRNLSISSYTVIKPAREARGPEGPARWER